MYLSVTLKNYLPIIRKFPKKRKKKYADPNLKIFSKNSFKKIVTTFLIKYITK